jgi:hypothetical protein
LRWLPRDCGYHRKAVEPARASEKKRKR